MKQVELINEAKKAREKAYTPYSKFNVGCAILMQDGKVIQGANIENASYGLSNCAERSALFSAYSQGYRKEDVISMVVVGDTDTPISPCGACRQVIHELVNDQTEIILTNLHDNIQVVSKKELLPFGFTDADLT